MTTIKVRPLLPITDATSDEVEFLAQAFALSDPSAVQRMIEGRELGADEIAEFATAPRDGRQVLAWNGHAWEIIQFDLRADRWESTYRGRGCELLDETIVARFTLWAPVPVVATW